METEQSSHHAGVIEEVMPSALYRVLLDSGRRVTAGASNSLRHRIVRLIVGDRVRVKLTSFDPSRAQIIEKL